MSRFIRLVSRRETFVPLLAVTFVSAATVLLVIARILWTADLRYCFLGWNLFLAWVPLAFALLACENAGARVAGNWKFICFTGAWLVFFPNAPYIFTDIIHLTGTLYRHFWVDMVLILLTALTGLVVGFLSLYLMQSVVANRAGRVASWVFIAVIAGLSGFGVYIGRFMRFNTWDLLMRPFDVARGVGHWAINPTGHSASLAFPVLFAIFLFLSYVMLYALTHLQQLQPPVIHRSPT